MVRSSVAFVLVVISAIPVAACSGQGSTETVIDTSTKSATSLASTTTSATTIPTPGRPVVIETDGAVEGLMSVIYLVGQPDLDIRAVTVSGTGLVHCEAGVAQTLEVLELIDAPDIPVACGPESPLEGINAFPTSWRADADRGSGTELVTSRSVAPVDAPSLLVSVVGDSPEPITVYTDGPQTNLAAALRLDPSISANIEMAYIMGGALDVPGNATRNADAEWNIWIDPVAADEVLRSGIPITLVPLDATNQVPFHVFHLEALENHQVAPGARIVVDMLERYDALAAGGLFFWDQLTAALLVDESLGTASLRDIEVVLDEDRHHAGTLVESASGSSTLVVESVDRERFETDFLSAIAGEDVGPIVVHPDWRVAFDGTAWSSDLPEAVEAGEYIVRLTNSGSGDAAVTFGWLTGEATLEDLDAWEGVSQPPFFELDSIVFAAPGSDVITKIELSAPQQYVIGGLDLAGDVGTRLGLVEVGRPSG